MAHAGDGFWHGVLGCFKYMHRQRSATVVSVAQRRGGYVARPLGYLLCLLFSCFCCMPNTGLVRNTLPELLCLSKKRFRRRPRPLHHVFLMPRGLVAVAALVEEGRQWSAPLFHMRFRSVLLHEAQKVRPKALDVHRAVLMVVASGEEGLLNGRANGGAQKLRPLKGAL